MPRRSAPPPSSGARGPLAEYFDKRTEGTNEPWGGGDEARGPTLEGAFVVHLHDASRLHYDVRLEIGGVLASFAVPRGVPLDPDDKRFAVATEDHPLEYLEFEDVIPEGNYGAGAMIVWDRGWVRWLEGPAEEERARGKLDLFFQGYKMRGRWALVKLQGPRATGGNEWLLIKKRDGGESTTRDLGAELPRSVLSGLTVTDRARAEEVAASWVARARALPGARALDPAAAPPRAFVRATPADDPPAGALYDPVLTGVRARLHKQGEVVSLWVDDGGGGATDVTDLYPELARAARALPLDAVTLDGEITAFDDDGRPSVTRLARRLARLRAGDAHGATYASGVQLACTDLLSIAAVDLTGAPLEERRALLETVLPTTPGVIRAIAPLDVSAADARALAAAHDLAGLVAKPRRGPWSPERAGWIFVASGAPRSVVALDHGAVAPRAAVRSVRVTNRDKIFWPALGITKGDLVAYYTRMAPAILPWTKDRPVILVRYPDGVDGKSFFQWNVPPAAPAWLRTVTFEDAEEKRKKRGFLLDDEAALGYVANLACIPIHILGCRTGSLAEADFLTVDFDVKQSSLGAAITLARALGEWLDEVGLAGYPKTSGQSGLHVLVPLGPGQSWTTARGLADLLGRLLVGRFPDLATMERTVGKRGARVYVDTGQTGPGRSIVAPWSVRASPGAGVSTPLRWDEVTPALDPSAFDLRSVPERFERDGDPMRPLLSAAADLPRAIARLAELAARLA